MDGKSYEIYLTKSPTVASLLSTALNAQMEGKKGYTVSWGAAKGDPRIPAICHEEDWFFATVEYVSTENTRPRYSLVIC